MDFLIDGSHKSALKEIAKVLKLNILNENQEVLQLSGVIQIDIVFANRAPTLSILANSTAKSISPNSFYEVVRDRWLGEAPQTLSQQKPTL